MGITAADESKLKKMKEEIILNENDVLFGRGSGMSRYVGTRRFRDLCYARKEEYNDAAKNQDKSAIAKELLDQVHALGGRFLQVQEDSEEADIGDRIWYEVDNKRALEKIKQTLRQNVKTPSPKPGAKAPQDGQAQGSDQKESEEGLAGAPANDLNFSFPFVHALSSLAQPTAATSSSTLPIIPPSLVGSTTVDRRLALLQQFAPLNPYCHALAAQQARLNLQQQQQQAAQIAAASLLAASPFPDLASLSLARVSPVLLHLQSQQQQPMQYPGASLAGMHDVLRDTNTLGTYMNPGLEGITSDAMRSSASENASERTEISLPANINSNISPVAAATIVSAAAASGGEGEDDVQDFLMSVLQLSGLPRFTNHEAERASMTEEEKAAALSDMFGKYCNVDTHQSKKARQGLDDESFALLVKEMRCELDKIPNEEKQALVKAQEACDAKEEFSDDRLERFLRCEGMDPKLAAQRFILYWKGRQELFGPEKYVMKMTLSEALRDDLVALEVGWLCLLPTKDASGRQLIVMEPSRHKREGYTTKSMLRVAWYVIEAASRLNTGTNSVVELVWDKTSTIWEYDHELYKKYFYYASNCWPVKFDCFHVCCTPKFIARVVIPICSALQGKPNRIRTVWHDESEEHILSALSEYGITREMLPGVFGGTLDFDQSVWIAQRRAIEMEEI